jgi:hypothetical protein
MQNEIDKITFKEDNSVINNTEDIAMTFEYQSGPEKWQHKIIFILGFWLGNPAWGFWMTISAITKSKVDLGVVNNRTGKWSLIRLRKST